MRPAVGAGPAVSLAVGDPGPGHEPEPAAIGPAPENSKSNEIGSPTLGAALRVLRITGGAVVVVVLAAARPTGIGIRQAQLEPKPTPPNPAAG
jgi:hypothetical protein